MQITLKPDQEQFIQEQLRSGNYHTADEVIVEALQLLKKRDQHYKQWLEQTQEQVAVSLSELDRGEGLDGESVVAKILGKFHQVRET